VTELGRIKVNIMNRTLMPPELDNLKTWKCWQDGRPLLLFDYSSVMSTSSLVGRISSPRSISGLSDTIKVIITLVMNQLTSIAIIWYSGRLCPTRSKGALVDVSDRLTQRPLWSERARKPLGFDIIVPPLFARLLSSRATWQRQTSPGIHSGPSLCGSFSYRW
jgi:hypothetical protein